MEERALVPGGSQQNEFSGSDLYFRNRASAAETLVLAAAAPLP